MEGLGAASAVIAVVSLAGQVVQGCNYLREVFENAITAPREIQLLAIELSIIEGLVQATPDFEQHREELDFCQERVAKLRKVVKKYGELGSVAPQKKWGKRSAHGGLLIKSDKILEQIQQLSTSNSESSRVVSRTEGKIEDIARITEQMQLALPELASRFMLREDSAMIRDEKLFQRLIESFSSMLRDQLSEHMSQLTLASQDLHQCQSDIQTVASGRKQICSPTAQGVATSPLDTGKRKRRTQSPIDQRIFELSDPSSRVPGDESNEHNHLKFESLSNYNTELGEVIMQTISAVYFSLEEISAVDFPSTFKEILMQQAHFPVTITTTEVLLLPRNWAQARGATLRREQLSGPICHLDDMCLEIKNFKRRRTSRKASVGPPKPEIETAPSNLTQLQKTLSPQRPTGSSLLLYTAFKTALLAAQLRSKDRWRPRQLQMISNIPISRNSFDSDINDALELVHLWIESRLDIEFYRTAFPPDGAVTEEQCEVALQAGIPHLGAFQQLRMEYVSKLVMGLVSRFDRFKPTKNSHLNKIHQNYWERVERMATSSSIILEVRSYTLISDAIDILHLPDRDTEWMISGELYFWLYRNWSQISMGDQRNAHYKIRGMAMRCLKSTAFLEQFSQHHHHQGINKLLTVICKLFKTARSTAHIEFESSLSYVNIINFILLVEGISLKLLDLAERLDLKSSYRAMLLCSFRRVSFHLLK